MHTYHPSESVHSSLNAIGLACYGMSQLRDAMVLSLLSHDFGSQDFGNHATSATMQAEMHSLSLVALPPKASKAGTYTSTILYRLGPAHC
jgi:hypothetical protein